METTIIDIITRPKWYIDKSVTIKECRVLPLEDSIDGWWHTLSDKTGSIMGFSGLRHKGEGLIQGQVTHKDIKIFIEF